MESWIQMRANLLLLEGIDTSTGTKFSGKLVADANASVVSPLTTMISKMMDLGASKNRSLDRTLLGPGT